MKRPHTILLIEDDPGIGGSLRTALEREGYQAIWKANGRSGLEYARDHHPHVIVLDVRLPGLSGMDLLRRLQQARRRMPVVMITGHGDIPMSVAAMKLGAVDFLTKPFRDQDLLDTIHAAVEKDRAQLASASGSDEVQARWDSLTDGEKAVMERVVRGMLNKQIAAELNVSEITVKVRRGRVMRKMQVRTLADLVRAGGQLGG